MEGYDANFDPPLEKRLECPICLLAQREPMQTPCGHRFCSACILRAIRETGPRCPVDKSKLCPHHLFKDNFAKREVLSLTVHCPAGDHGCGWQGELRDLEVHAKLCDMVSINCPHLCGHTCHRKALSAHLLSCPNKPDCCPTCSIHFPKNKIEEHAPLCSTIVLSQSTQASLFKANEVLKWIGHLKLRLNNQNVQVTGYLSVKAESEESFLFTGTWYNTLNVIPLNSGAAKIFWKMLHGPEVHPIFFNFAVMNPGDPSASMFHKMLKKKVDHLHAAVGLRLRQMNRRDLTLIYFYWSEEKKRLTACVAEIKCHLVRQIQSRLQLLQQTRSRRGGRHSRGSRPTPASNPPPVSPHPSYPHIHTNPHPQHMAHPHSRHFIPHLHSHAHAHPVAPPPNINVRVVNVPPSQQQPQPVHPASRSSTGAILPSFLSWQMSQSLNTFPWRMQPTGVPFFTIPSTPPQFLPANSYPYTFAPLPAAPFSISPMPSVNVPSSVPLTSYTGIAVPQVVAAEHTIPLPNAGTLGAPHPSFSVPAAALQPLATAGSNNEVPTVTVTLSGVNPIDPNTATLAAAVPVGVISQSTIDGASHMPLLQGPYQAEFSVPNPPSAIVQAEVANMGAQGAGFMHGSNILRRPNERSSGDSGQMRPAGRSAIETETGAYVVRLVTSGNRGSNVLRVGPAGGVGFSPISSSRLSDSPSNGILSWEDAHGDPSGHLDPGSLSSSPSDSDSSGTSSPATRFLTFSPLDSSDSDSPGLDSPFASFAAAVDQSVTSMDGVSDQESGLNQSDSEVQPSTDSALHTLANAAAILADSSEGNSSGINETHNPFSLGSNHTPGSSLRTSNAIRPRNYLAPPPNSTVIHLDSDSESHVASPSSVIDLTQSPLSLSPPADARERSRSLQTRLFESNHSTSRLPDSEAPMLMPVIQLANSSVMDSGSLGSSRTRQYVRADEYTPTQRILSPPGPLSTARHQVSAHMHNLHHTHQVQTMHPAHVPLIAQPDFVNAAAVPVLSWPYERTENGGLAAAATAHHTVLTTPVFAPAAIAARPPGNFWDTVIPSLDISLQNGDNRSTQH